MQDTQKRNNILAQLKVSSPQNDPEDFLSYTDLPKPSALVNDLMPLHQAIASDRALGMSADAIAEKYEMSLGSVNALENQKFFQSLVIKMQGILDIPVEQRVENAATVAFEKRYALLTDPKTDPKLVEKISEGFLDRKMGRAPAKLEVTSRNFNVSGTLDQLTKDTQRVQEQIDAIEHEKQKLLAS